MMALDHPSEIAAQAASLQQHEAEGREVAEILSLTILRSARRNDHVTLTVLDYWIGHFSPRLPALLTPWLDDLRADADLWCDCASKEQVAAMTAACLAELPRRDFALNTRKKLLVALWNSLGAEDRRAFRDRVMQGDRQ